jgi:hypothetical protein
VARTASSCRLLTYVFRKFQEEANDPQLRSIPRTAEGSRRYTRFSLGTSNPGAHHPLLVGPLQVLKLRVIKNGVSRFHQVRSLGCTGFKCVGLAQKNPPELEA